MMITSMIQNLAINAGILFLLPFGTFKLIINKDVKAIVCVCICLFLIGCTSAPPTGVPDWAGTYRNACLPEAIAVAQGLREEEIQAKVLTIYTEKWGHATCAYLYPPGKNRLWVWDSRWQSVPLRAWWNDPMSIARAWMAWRYDETPIRRAYFHEDLSEDKITLSLLKEPTQITD